MNYDCVGGVMVQETSSGTASVPAASSTVPGVVLTTQFDPAGAAAAAQTAAINAAKPTLETVTFSASPAFSPTTTYSRFTLTADVTSSTLPAGTDGALKTFFVCQDSAGGHLFTFPAGVFGAGVVGTTSGKCSQQIFSYSLLTGHVGWYAAGIMITNL